MGKCNLKFVSNFVTKNKKGGGELVTIMYNFYSTPRCDSNTPLFTENGHYLMEKRPKIFGREVRNFWLKYIIKWQIR